MAANFSEVHRRIGEACARAGRDPRTVRLLAVTKNVPAQVITEAAGLGQTLFGENRVQEAKLKKGQCPGRLHWHMIGHLQTNKCRDAVTLFEMVQSVDSLRMAAELNKQAEKFGKHLPILLEVNIAGEATKFGYPPAQLLKEFNELNALSRLEIHGLMCVPPWTPDPERAREFFRKMRELKAECENVLGAPLPELSMGMSHDFEIAVEEGATMVRLGTILFGERPKMRARSEAEDEE